MFVVAAALLAACADDASKPPHDTLTDTASRRAPAPGPLGPQPAFGAAVHASLPPPPISGGTMAVAPGAGRNVVVVSDPDRDQVHVVDVATGVVLKVVAFARGSEPGRVVVDDADRAYVVLRGSNEVATFAVDDAAADAVLYSVCAAPRGVAYLTQPARIVVACVDGNLDVLRADTGERLERHQLGRDLRDVLVDPGDLDTVHVTRFRSAELFKLHLGEGHTPWPWQKLPGSSVAWRGISLPSGGFAIAEQEAQTDTHTSDAERELQPVSGGYGATDVRGRSEVKDTCDAVTGIVRARVEIAGGPALRLPAAVLPVDLAASPTEIVVVAAGNAFVPGVPQLFTVETADLDKANGDCVHVTGTYLRGQAIAAVFAPSGELVVQTREPNALHVISKERWSAERIIPLPGESVADTGHVIFHSNAGNFLACASCHPEGMEDGRTWVFAGKGPRRTPALRGTLRGTAPFHWDGDMRDLRQLVDDVFSSRMSGPPVDDGQFDALSDWLFSLPPPTRLREPSEASGRGQTLFAERCSSCHEGERLTNNRTVDVGTGAALQVPSLVGVAWRAPYQHDGCAPTLLDRFDPRCSTELHGDTRGLVDADFADIVAYLETL